MIQDPSVRKTSSTQTRLLFLNDFQYHFTILFSQCMFRWIVLDIDVLLSWVLYILYYIFLLFNKFSLYFFVSEKSQESDRDVDV